METMFSQLGSPAVIVVQWQTNEKLKKKKKNVSLDFHSEGQKGAEGKNK